MQRCVIILSDRSLFAEGIASRLRECLQQVQLRVIELQGADVLEQVIAVQPSAVIIDTTEPDNIPFCFLSRLQLALPRLTIVCLDSRRGHIQVLTSEQRTADQVRDLLQVIGTLD